MNDQKKKNPNQTKQKNQKQLQQNKKNRKKKKNLIIFSKSWKALGFSENLPTSGSWQKSGRIFHMPHITNTSSKML